MSFISTFLKVGQAKGPSGAEAEQLKAADERMDQIAQEVTKHSSVQEQVTDLWAYIRRRAYAEAIEKGILEEHHARLSVKAKQVFKADPLLGQDLWQYYQNGGHELREDQLFVEIEKRFGERIVTSICIPLGIHAGACLLAAIQLCREDPLD